MILQQQASINQLVVTVRALTHETKNIKGKVIDCEDDIDGILHQQHVGMSSSSAAVDANPVVTSNDSTTLDAAVTSLGEGSHVSNG